MGQLEWPLFPSPVRFESVSLRPEHTAHLCVLQVEAANDASQPLLEKGSDVPRSSYPSAFRCLGQPCHGHYLPGIPQHRNDALHLLWEFNTVHSLFSSYLHLKAHESLSTEETLRFPRAW